VSLVVGAFSFTVSNAGSSSSSDVSGSTTVGDSIHIITNNTLTSCNASSVTSGGGGSIGANVYGGGISLIVGAFSYVISNDGGSTSSNVSGSTTVGNTSFAITSNTLISCIALSVTTAGYGSNGANVYGGGLSQVVGAYSYSFSNDGDSSISSVSGNTTVGSSSYTITSNTLTSCNASSVNSGFGSYAGEPVQSSGANVYGGGMSLVVGAYSRSLSNGGSSSSSSVSGSTTVGKTSYTITSNTLTSCNSSSVTSQANNLDGSNVYGGGMSLVVGVNSYSFCEGDITSASSIVSGSTTVGNTGFAITSNTLTSCSASSVAYGESSSTGANVYGGGILLVVGPYSYSSSEAGNSSSSSVSGSTTVGNTGYTINSNTLTSCSASSVAYGESSFSGANVYGGGISLLAGACSYSINNAGSISSSSNVSSSTIVSITSFTITSNTLTSCNASSVASGGSMLSEQMFTAAAYCWLWEPILTATALLETAAAAYQAAQQSAIRATRSQATR
jgi:hypothetical protein